MNKSILELINIILRKIKIVELYQGNDSRQPSSLEHISTGVIVTLFFSLLGHYFLPLKYIVPLIWLYYAFFVELYLDRFKNKGRPDHEVIAQVLERSAGFVVSLPFYVFL